jgi:hypothetical protein
MSLLILRRLGCSRSRHVYLPIRPYHHVMWRYGWERNISMVPPFQMLKTTNVPLWLMLLQRHTNGWTYWLKMDGKVPRGFEKFFKDFVWPVKPSSVKAASENTPNGKN